MPDLPTTLALTSIADGSAMTAAPVRNNFSALQTFGNAILAALSGGSAGQVLTATDTDTVSWGGRMIRGQVASDGSVALGSGFSASKTATGSYTVTFTTAYSGTPIVVVSAHAQIVFAAVNTSSTSSFTVKVCNDLGALVDGAFNFIAIEV